MKILIFLLMIVLSFTSVVADEWQVNYVYSISDGLKAPTSLAISDDKIAVLEPFEQQIKIFTSEGLFLQKIFIEGDGTGLVQMGNDVYLYCDLKKKQVISIKLSDGSQSDFFEGRYTFIDPVDITVSGAYVYVLDAGSQQIIKYHTGDLSLSVIDIVNPEGHYTISPSAFCFDRNSNIFYILNQTECNVWAVSDDGSFVRSIASFGGGAGQISRTGDIVLDANSLLYISDRYQGRVITYTTDGEFIGNIDFSTTGQIGLHIPSGLAVDTDNLLYIASTESETVHIFYSLFTPSVYYYYADQIYPDRFDTVKSQDIIFTASTVSQTDSESIKGFDFELFQSDDTLNSLYSGVQVEPVKIFDSVSSGWMYKAEWLIEDTLSVEHDYFWRSRVNTENQIGSWSQMSFFSVSNLPEYFHLYQNYPNPFNPATTIQFDLPKRSHTTLTVYNITGQIVTTLVDERLDAGHHKITFSTSEVNLSSGIYFYRLSTDDSQQSKKMILIK